MQNFILQSSSFLLEATHNLVQFTSVLIEVPSTWTGCTAVTSPSPKRIPLAAADVILREGVPARAFQPELCGVKVTFRSLYRWDPAFSCACFPRNLTNGIGPMSYC